MVQRLAYPTGLSPDVFRRIDAYLSMLNFREPGLANIQQIFTMVSEELQLLGYQLTLVDGDLRFFRVPYRGHGKPPVRLRQRLCAVDECLGVVEWFGPTKELSIAEQRTLEQVSGLSAYVLYNVIHRERERLHPVRYLRPCTDGKERCHPAA